MKRSLWMDRDLMLGPYLALCLTQAQYNQAMADLDIKDPGPMVKNGYSHATTHFAESPKGDLCAVVALSDTAGRTGIEIAGLLVHEAVHVWQWHHERIGEDAPSHEFEAYAVQIISQRLMWRYQELTS
jgi:hypothetical protein